MSKIEALINCLEYWEDETIERAWDDCCRSLGTPGAAYSEDQLAAFLVEKGVGGYEDIDADELEDEFTQQYFGDCEDTDPISEILEHRCEDNESLLLTSDWDKLAEEIRDIVSSAAAFRERLSDRTGEAFSVQGVTYSGEYGPGDLHSVCLTEEGIVELCYGDEGNVDGLSFNELSVEIMSEIMKHMD